MISRRTFALAGAGFFPFAILVSTVHVAAHLDHHIPQASCHHSSHDVEHSDSHANHCPLCEFVRGKVAGFQSPALLSGPTFIPEAYLAEAIFSLHTSIVTLPNSRGPPPVTTAP